VRWVPSQVVKGVPYDTPVLGYHTGTANLLRLWKSEAVESFDFDAFNTGDYFGAVEAEGGFREHLEGPLSERLGRAGQAPAPGTAVLLCVSCSLQDALRAALRMGVPPTRFHERYAFQLNDTHPRSAWPS
jgi:glycogen phosphorylase